MTSRPPMAIPRFSGPAPALALVLGLLLWGTPAPLAAQPVPTARDAPADLADRRAQSLFVRGLTEAYLADYDEAVSYFEKALEAAPEAPALLLALGEAEAARDNVTSALYYARQARDRGNHPHYHQSLAELLRSANRPREAATAYRTLLDSFPDQPDARRALAALQADLDQPRAALRTYEALIESTERPQPDSVYADMLALYEEVGDAAGQERMLRTLIERRRSARPYRRKLGALLVEQERYEEAVPLYEGLLRETPNAPRLLSRLKMLYDRTGQTEAAEALWQRFSSADASPDQQVQRARLLYEKARRPAADLDSASIAPAVALLRSVLDADSTHLGALDLLGTLYYETGAYARAAPVLQRALDENPRDPDRWARAAAAFLKAGQPQTAATVAEEGRLLFPGRTSLLRTLATASLRLGDSDAALSHYRTAIEEEGEDAPDSTRAALYAGMGRAHSRLGQARQATDAFETALRLDATQPAALSHYAVHLVDEGTSLNRALDLAQRAVDHRPTSPTARAALGWVFFKRDAPTEARTHFERAVAAGTAPVWVYVRFGDLHHALGNDARARQYWKEALDRAPGRTPLQNKLDTLPES